MLTSFSHSNILFCDYMLTLWITGILCGIRCYLVRRTISHVSQSYYPEGPSEILGVVAIDFYIIVKIVVEGRICFFF